MVYISGIYIANWIQLGDSFGTTDSHLSRGTRNNYCDLIAARIHPGVDIPPFAWSQLDRPDRPDRPATAALRVKELTEIHGTWRGSFSSGSNSRERYALTKKCDRIFSWVFQESSSFFVFSFGGVGGFLFVCLGTLKEGIRIRRFFFCSFRFFFGAGRGGVS